jgi:hypothetical protein
MGKDDKDEDEEDEQMLMVVSARVARRLPVLRSVPACSSLAMWGKLSWHPLIRSTLIDY